MNDQEDSSRKFKESLDVFRRRTKAKKCVPGPDTWLVYCDASFKCGRAGIAVQIIKGKSSEMIEIRVNARGAQHAELKAIRLGLQELSKRAGSHVTALVQNDSEWAIETCLGANEPQRDYIKAEIGKIRDVEIHFKEVLYKKCTGREIRRADKASKRTRKRT
jgi:ribonuclease HI